MAITSPTYTHYLLVLWYHIIKYIIEYVIAKDAFVAPTTCRTLWLWKHNVTSRCSSSIDITKVTLEIIYPTIHIYDILSWYKCVVWHGCQNHDPDHNHTF